MIAWWVLDENDIREPVKLIQSRSHFAIICWKSVCQRHHSRKFCVTSALTVLVIIANFWSGSEIELRMLGFEASL